MVPVEAWDSTKPPYMVELVSNWALSAGSLALAAPVIWLKVKDHVAVEDDLEGTDETVDDVLPVGYPEGHHVSRV